MSGSESDKIKQAAVIKFRVGLKDNLFAIILTGSASTGTYKAGWSDLDLLVIVEHLDFDTKRLVAGATAELENASNVHHGLNIITKEELEKPTNPEILLDGKTIQALIDLRKYPGRLLYSKEHIDLNNIYSPNEATIKAYSLSNIGMFLRRNRRTLTKATDHSADELKELLKKEMRAAIIIIKLAVQYLTGIPQDDYQSTIQRAKVLFPAFNFEAIKINFKIISDWNNLNDGDEIIKVFRWTDKFIEDFSHYVFTQIKK